MIKTRRIWAGLLFCLCLSGCASQNQENITKNKGIEPYVRYQYEPYIAEEVSIQPEVRLDLLCDGLEQKQYFPAGDDMVVQEILVAKGDTVKEGDVLLRYKTENLEEQIKAYQDEIAMNQMLYQHYEKLNEIEPSESLKITLDQLRRSIDTDTMYIRELNGRILDSCILAEGDGTVTEIAKDIENQHVSKKQQLLTVVYTDGIYKAQTEEPVGLEPGRIYEGFSGLSSYDLEFIGFEKAEEGKDELRFRYVSQDDTVCTRSRLEVILKQTAIEGSICIPDSYLKGQEGDYFVYVLDEANFCRVRPVSVAGIVEHQAIVESGLTAGDKVVKR